MGARSAVQVCRSAVQIAGAHRNVPAAFDPNPTVQFSTFLFAVSVRVGTSLGNW
jgi:hypothetical protein